jgi:hypothetical protein
MMDKVWVAQSDTAPKLRRTLRDANGPVNLAAIGNAVFFSMRKIDPPNLTAQVDNADVTIIDALNGVVEYAWDPADLTNTGVFLGEFRVSYGPPGFELATFPNGPEKIYITVTGRVA